MTGFSSVLDRCRDNQFILTGYRVNWSWKQAAWSIFHIHNETGNIWTHLLGFVFFVTLTCSVAWSPSYTLTARLVVPARHTTVSLCGLSTQATWRSEGVAGWLIAIRNTWQHPPRRHLPCGSSSSNR